MGAVWRSKRSWCSMMRLAFASVFALWAFTVNSAVLISERELSNHKHARRKLDDIGGSISIDCGILEDLSYTDDKTEIHYASDAEFIDVGENKNISSKFNTETLQRSLWNVRSFPQGNRGCYTLKPPEGNDTSYFIRASFMYGNYDGQDRLPEFDLYVGVNQWDTIKFDNASHIVIKEIIYVALMDHIHVCLLNTGSGTPFISALELRHFHNSSYKTESGSLLLYRRFDIGSTTGQIVRYKDDAYDRMWFPHNLPQSIPFNSSSAIDAFNSSEYKLPSTVMKTAVVPKNANDSLDFELDTGDPTLEFHVYLHFAELESLQDSEYREFNIDINGNLWSEREAVVPKYLSSKTLDIHSVRGPKLSFTLYKTQNSTLPPILNAMEVYIVKDFLQAPTDQDDINAIMDVKINYGVAKFWKGDPCLPKPAWDGLQCSYNGYDPPRINSLNLGSSGLTGTISTSFGGLKSLQYLDLSNNSLTGTLPEFLSQFPDLRAVNLSRNKLSGSVPSALMERSRSGSLSLSVDGNPDLCVMAPCKKEKKNFAVRLIAALVSSLVVLIVLVILWSYKRKRAATQVARTHQRSGSLKSDNREFTYYEVISITKNFQTIIGKGGFGTVYHGRLRDGTEVAVKMLSPSSTQGSQQFLTEVELLMRVHHRNLVAFIAYCNEGTNIGIIYEYMARGNLAEYLSDKRKDALTWKERLQIAVDAAQGLEYLHHGCKPPIIHRDVKTANILLNEKMQTKLADFGLSKCFQVESQSHLSTSVVGTLGYLDPEYYTYNRLTERSDVYSFGIVLLEIITGRPAIIKSEGNTHIVQWVGPLFQRGDIRSIFDPRLQENFNINSGWKALETAMACAPLNSNQRPTMSHVLMELKECLEMEYAYEQNSGMQSLMMESCSTFEMRPMGLETEMIPLAR